MDDLDFFAVCPPGLERYLAAEVREKTFQRGKHEPGGVSLRGSWSEIWRANLELRGATRILVRIGAFRAVHYKQLEAEAAAFPWCDWLDPKVPLRVEAATNKSKLHHAGAVKTRMSDALTRAGFKVDPEGPVTLKLRLDQDLATLSIDTSGKSLHKRGQKGFSGKAPIRENLAVLLLRACDYDGTEPLVDPMCGSGTFLFEGAGMAGDLQPGRARDFAFQQLPSFDAGNYAALVRPSPTHEIPAQFFGYDRDAGAISGARANAKAHGLTEAIRFECQSVSELRCPFRQPGLVIVNPPYGARIGNKGPLFALYGTLGKRLSEQYLGWRVGVVTSDGALVKAMGLTLGSGPVLDNGGIKVKLYKGTID